jgi:alpha-beta hydrolase superfamily lysophospholipase
VIQRLMTLRWARPPQLERPRPSFDMGLRPRACSLARTAAVLARECAARALAREPLEAIGAALLVRAPNAGRTCPPAVRDEQRVEIAAPHAILSIALLEPLRPKGTVFVLHGIRNSKESMRGWGAMLVGAGYRAVLVDSRGHGSSTGHTLTYGVQEAKDLSVALAALEMRGMDLGPVGAMGHSYGAATAIQWAGREARVGAVIAVSPFASLREVVSSYLPWTLPPEFSRRAVDLAGALGDFDPDAASSVDAIASTRAPVLLIHGRADARIPCCHSERIRAAAVSTAELVLVAGAGHDSVACARQTRLAERAVAWLDTHLIDAAAAR